MEITSLAHWMCTVCSGSAWMATTGSGIASAVYFSGSKNDTISAREHLPMVSEQERDLVITISTNRA